MLFITEFKSEPKQTVLSEIISIACLLQSAQLPSDGPSFPLAPSPAPATSPRRQPQAHMVMQKDQESRSTGSELGVGCDDLKCFSLDIGVVFLSESTNKSRLQSGHFINLSCEHIDENHYIVSEISQ